MSNIGNKEVNYILPRANKTKYGCEYCNGEKDIFYLGGGIMQGDKYLMIEGGKLIVWEEYCNEPVHSLDIKFCPVCGKKLN